MKGRTRKRSSRRCVNKCIKRGKHKCGVKCRRRTQVKRRKRRGGNPLIVL